MIVKSSINKSAKKKREKRKKDLTTELSKKFAILNLLCSSEKTKRVLNNYKTTKTHICPRGFFFEEPELADREKSAVKTAGIEEIFWFFPLLAYHEFGM